MGEIHDRAGQARGDFPEHGVDESRTSRLADDVLVVRIAVAVQGDVRPAGRATPDDEWGDGDELVVVVDEHRDRLPTGGRRQATRRAIRRSGTPCGCRPVRRGRSIALA